MADGLFERLRALRKELAEENSVPAYIVFSDRTLMEMAEVRPRNEMEMLAVGGVGEHKLQKYGRQFLSEIQWYLSEKKTVNNS